MHRRGRSTRRAVGTEQGAYREPRQDTSKRQLALMIGPVVYFARTADGLVKVGWTSDLSRRAGNLGGWDAILAFRTGTLADEADLHVEFAEHRARGDEFYHPDQPVLDAVNEIRAGYRLPTVDRAAFTV